MPSALAFIKESHMKSKKVGGGKAYAHRQQPLFPSGDEPRDAPADLSQDCQVVAVGKRRDGAMRYGVFGTRPTRRRNIVDRRSSAAPRISRQLARPIHWH